MTTQHYCGSLDTCESVGLVKCYITCENVQKTYLSEVVGLCGSCPILLWHALRTKLSSGMGRAGSSVAMCVTCHLI